MANDFFVPFNYEPTSTSVESGTYNLAAGSYAKITAIEFNAALVADGEQLLPRYDFKEIDKSCSTTQDRLLINLRDLYHQRSGNPNHRKYPKNS